jgi:hypothetical protein
MGESPPAGSLTFDAPTRFGGPGGGGPPLVGLLRAGGYAPSSMILTYLRKRRRIIPEAGTEWWAMEKELFKELYLYELQRKEELTGRVTVLLTAVTVVGAFGGYLLKAYQIKSDLWSLIVGVLLLAALILYSRSVYCLTRLYSGYEYEAMPTPAKLQAYYEELEAFYQANPEEEGNVDSTFTKYLNRKYSKATEVNVQNNEIKAAYHAASLQSLIFTLMCATLAALAPLLRSVLALN